ncbi:MAG: guanylate kinase [Myxococcales bacterium]|nr:guanylate kinase [Myxococcales bacterium]
MSIETRPGNLLVVTAPSGAGKTTLCRSVIERLEPTIRYSISHTTRPPRGNERNGVDYHFVADAEFDRLIGENQMAEWATIHGHRYGTSRAEIEDSQARGQDLFLDIEGQGAVQIKKLFPQAILIYILPPSLADLRDRLLRRGSDAPAEIERRWENARRELAFLPNYDYIIVNDILSEATRGLEAIVLAARQRRENMQDAIRRFPAAPQS